MAKGFFATAQGVLSGVGGMENIKNVVHCATRLRFTLSDISKADDEAIKATSGVVSVVKAGGLYQVIIGNDVPEVFAELKKLGGKGFEPRVQEGETVKAGQLLLEYDKDLIARSGYSLETQVVVTNTGDFKAVTQAASGDCKAGDLVLYVES